MTCINSLSSWWGGTVINAIGCWTCSPPVGNSATTSHPGDVVLCVITGTLASDGVNTMTPSHLNCYLFQKVTAKSRTWPYTCCMVSNLEIHQNYPRFRRSYWKIALITGTYWTALLGRKTLNKTFARVHWWTQFVSRIDLFTWPTPEG